MSTCRFCGGYEDQGSKYPLIKYSVRHYAHADCGLKAKGVAFFDLLHDWQIEQFPYFAARDLGLSGDLVERVQKIEQRGA